VSLFFPPLRARELRSSSFDLTRQRHCRTSDFAERPARLDTNIDVHAARATRLGPTAQSHLFQQRLHFERDQTHAFPFRTWTRIEIDTHFSRMIEIIRSHRMRVKLNAAEIDNPNKSSLIINHNFVSSAPGWKRQRYRAQPLGMILRRALLVENLTLGA